MPQDIHATCDDCGKKFSIEQPLSCPKGGLLLARHDDATKEWGALGSRILLPSAITYELKINIYSDKLHLQYYLEMLLSEMGYFGLLGNNFILFIILLYIIEG